MSDDEWSVYPPLTRDTIHSCQLVGVRYLHAQILANRGIISPEAMRRFIQASLEDLYDPLDLPDMACAVERIRRALTMHEHIAIFGDFDADGVTSAALLFKALRMLGHQALSCFIPHRTQQERGLSRNALDQLRATGVSLVVTTDCGSSDVEAVAYAQDELHIDVIVTDHHSPPDVLPQAHAVVNPWIAGSTNPETYLCGVGIAYKLAQALFRAAAHEGEERSLLDLVAVGTIADVAKLLGENHTLVREGLKRLNATANPGLQALIKVSGLRPGAIREGDVAFGIAPRLNAAGRMQHANIAFQLLTTEDSVEALVLAQKLEQLNCLRKEQTSQLMELANEQAQSQIEESVLLISGPQNTYHEGIIGLVAGKLAEQWKRPVFVLSQGENTSRGSARSYGGFNLIEALHARSDLFARCGGHAGAAGFTIANTDIEALREHLSTCFASAGTNKADGGAPGTASRWIDLVVGRPEALDGAAYTLVTQLGPFGSGNPEPVFRMNNLKVVSCRVSHYDGETLLLQLQAGARMFEGKYKEEGMHPWCFEAGAVVHVIFCLTAAKSLEQRDIRLKILSMERALL